MVYIRYQPRKGAVAVSIGGHDVDGCEVLVAVLIHSPDGVQKKDGGLQAGNASQWRSHAAGRFWL